MEGVEKYLDEIEWRQLTGSIVEFSKDYDEDRLEFLDGDARIETEATITFYVAECREFPVLREYHGRLETLQEAMELYENIPAERMSGTEFINEIPQYRDSPLVQKAIVDMEAILSGRAERDVSEQQKKAKVSKRKTAKRNAQKEMQTQKTRETGIPGKEGGENAASRQINVSEQEKSPERDRKTGRNISRVSKKESVLNALWERQKMKVQKKEKQEQKLQEQKKDEKGL